MSLDLAMARRWHTQLIADCGAVEIRKIRPSDAAHPRIVSGWFNDPSAMMDVIQAQEEGDNLYTTLNRAEGHRVLNRFDQYAKAAKDPEVTKYCRLLFDFDPVRESGPATTGEMAMAQDRARQFQRYLSGFGFPRPATATSGNGAHLIYRVGVPDVDILHEFLQRLYRILGERHSDDWVDFDVTVRNPAQLTRAYGAINYKGAATPDRPHRVSTVWMPESYRPVPPNKLWNLIQAVGADTEPKRAPPVMRSGDGVKTGTGDYSTLDVVSWLSALGIYLKALGSDKHAVICPWRSQHTGGGKLDKTKDAVVFQNHGGTPRFKCLHAHCDGRGLFEVIEALGGADDFCTSTFRSKAK